LAGRENKRPLKGGVWCAFFSFGVLGRPRQEEGIKLPPLKGRWKTGQKRGACTLKKFKGGGTGPKKEIKPLGPKNERDTRATIQTEEKSPSPQWGK